MELEAELQATIDGFAKEIGIPKKVTLIYDSGKEIHKRIKQFFKQHGYNLNVGGLNKAYAALNQLCAYVPGFWPKDAPVMCVVKEQYDKPDNYKKKTLWHELAHMRDLLYCDSPAMMIAVNELIQITDDDNYVKRPRQEGFNLWTSNQLFEKGLLSSLRYSPPAIQDYQECILDWFADSNITNKSVKDEAVAFAVADTAKIEQLDRWYKSLPPEMRFVRRVLAMDLAVRELYAGDENRHHFQRCETLLNDYQEIISECRDR